MERTILRCSYLLGIITLVIAFAWKALTAFGVHLSAQITRSQAISYMTFYKASLLLFVAAVASVSYGSLKSPRS